MTNNQHTSFNTTKDTKFKLLHVDRGIAYFEGGWWMHDQDRWILERIRNSFGIPRIKVNKETKQIEIDKTIYP
jgi:hypothetical protein